MALTDYTTYETIRAVVGVAETEIPDDILAQPNFEQAVVFALSELNPTLPTQYATVAAVNPPSGRTAAQVSFYNLVQVFAAYTVGQVLLDGSIELFAPKTIQDGKAMGDRIDDPFKTLRANIGAYVVVWGDRLLAALLVLDSAQTVTKRPARTHILTSAGADPVTGA